MDEGLRIGTSGWHYADWFGAFYPAGMRKKDALAFYVTQFRTAELNAPFYRTPAEETVAKWRESTPEDFRFAWKASKFITHWRRLQIDANSMQLLESRLAQLGPKLGPVLFQLPPKFERDRERLARFLAQLDPRRRYSFEFRHPSWYDAEIIRLLGDCNVALCLSDHHDAPAPSLATASFVYVRNHGPGGHYHGSYSDPALAEWARLIAAWRGEGRDVYCYFDNDVKGAAPFDARRLDMQVRRRLRRPASTAA